MKGISAVIGALIVLIITIVLGSLAYTYIIGTAEKTTGTVLTLDETNSVCSAGAVSTISVKNDGSSAVPWNSVKVKLINSQGTSGTAVTCTTAANLAAGSFGTCGATLSVVVANGGVAATAGTNKVIITSGTYQSTGLITC